MEQEVKLSDVLRNVRMMRGYSANWVAKQIGRATNTLINWEKGIVSPDVDSVLELCKVYNIRPNEMFGWEPCPELEEFMEQKEKIIIEIQDLQKQKSAIEARIKALHSALQRRTVFDEAFTEEDMKKMIKPQG